MQLHEKQSVTSVEVIEEQTTKTESPIRDVFIALVNFVTDDGQVVTFRLPENHPHSPSKLDAFTAEFEDGQTAQSALKAKLETYGVHFSDTEIAKWALLGTDIQVGNYGKGDINDYRANKRIFFRAKVSKKKLKEIQAKINSDPQKQVSKDGKPEVYSGYELLSKITADKATTEFRREIIATSILNALSLGHLEKQYARAAEDFAELIVLAGVDNINEDGYYKKEKAQAISASQELALRRPKNRMHNISTGPRPDEIIENYIINEAPSWDVSEQIWNIEDKNNWRLQRVDGKARRERVYKPKQKTA